jgi:RNA-directed DNA polymerase
VDQLLNAGKVWVVDADLKGYFDSIPQDKLMEAVEEHIADGPLLELIWQLLKRGVMETGKEWQPTETGTPQGAVISPLLANIYLNPLDHLMARAGKEMLRYADDFVILCDSQEEAMATLEQVRQWTAQAGLQLHPVKTRIVDASQKGGFEFLGYHFEQGRYWPRKKSIQKLKETIRQKTSRLRPDSMEKIIDQINPTLRGWYGYFKPCKAHVFEAIDGWVRGRLRAIHRKRQRRKGRARMMESKELPNTYFTHIGLISLALARKNASQPTW